MMTMMKTTTCGVGNCIFRKTGNHAIKADTQGLHAHRFQRRPARDGYVSCQALNQQASATANQEVAYARVYQRQNRSIVKEHVHLNTIPSHPAHLNTSFSQQTHFNKSSPQHSSPQRSLSKNILTHANRSTNSLDSTQADLNIIMVMSTQLIVSSSQRKLVFTNSPQ